MRKKKTLKGFTLTELAIVIAVIAILIAVLVPTFISLINSANESKDAQLAKNMNTTLSTYGSTPETPHEMLEALEEDGYLLKNMTPTSDGYSYIWDEKTNSIALIDGEFNFVYNGSSVSLSKDDSSTTLWAIVSSQSQINTFKNSDYSFKYCIVATEEVTVDNSFDSCYAGDANVKLVNTEADDLTYTMYTDGGEFTINTPNCSVEHYGDASLVNVTAVKTSSYHVYGEVKMAVLTAGRLVVEDNANVNILAITASSGYSVKVSTEKVSDSIGTIYTTVSSSSGTSTTVPVTTSTGSTNADAIESSSITSLSNITYITTGTQLEEFINAGSGMCVLKNDVTINCEIKLDSGKFMMIDLNSYTLTSIYAYSNKIENQSSELAISNGKMVFNGITDYTKATFSIATESKITLNSVVAETTACMLYPYGSAAEVNVIGSTITSKGAYCVATNAGDTSHYGVAINLQNSTFVGEYVSNNDYGDNCPVLINVPGTLVINNCTITGQRQGVIVRGGEATITNTTITCTGSCTSQKYYTSGTWSSGNEVPMGALIVGNYSTSYKYTSKCTLSGVTLIAGTNQDGNNQLVYMYSSNGYRVDLIYDSSCNITNADVNGKDVYNDENSTGGCYINGDKYINDNKVSN